MAWSSEFVDRLVAHEPELMQISYDALARKKRSETVYFYLEIPTFDAFVLTIPSMSARSPAAHRMYASWL